MPAFDPQCSAIASEQKLPPARCCAKTDTEPFTLMFHTILSKRTILEALVCKVYAKRLLCLAAAFGGAASCRLNRHRVADRPPQAARSDTVTPQKFILHRSGLLCQAARSEMPYRPSSGWPNIVRGKSLVTKSGGCCGTGCCAGQRAAPAPRLMSAL